MTTSRIQFPHEQRFTTWFLDFLRKELAPYPGRGMIVARTVVAATVTAILIVTFRIPGGAIGALCAFVLSRENLLSTARSALNFVVAFAIGGLFIPIGARFFASTPFTHFLWEAVSLFFIFFLLRTLTNFAVAISLSLMATNILAIWYLPGPAQRNVELTLWQVAAALIGALVTLAVEAVFHAIHRGDELLEGLDVRLEQIEKLMRTYGAGQTISPENAQLLAQYAVIGVGALRRYIARTSDEPEHRARTSALVSIVGRSIDFAAALSTTVTVCDLSEQPRAAALAQRLAQLRECLKNNNPILPWEENFRSKEGKPLLSGLEAMVALIPSVLSSGTAIDPRLQILDAPPTSGRIFVADAFTNPEHLRYVLSGTLAAMLCYTLYVALAWPGLSTSVTTCVLTALSNVGASRQKQVLRVAGAILGGFVFGMGSQIFILPNIDSIAGFAMLFATVSAIAAWIGTSSSRLSYAGLQLALAFYLINLSEFTIQTSLTAARDRSIGVLLGTFMMWLVFERFYPRPAADEMVSIFIRNLRLMAELAEFSATGDDTAAIIKLRRQRDQVYRYFGEVNAQADAVPFETGSARVGHMAARDRLRRWQAALRTFYLLQTPLLQFRVFADERERASPFFGIELNLRQQCGQVFMHISDCLESQLEKQAYANTRPCNLQPLLAASLPKEGAGFSEREAALLSMLRTIASLVDRFEAEVAAEPLYATAEQEPNAGDPTGSVALT
jgi:multidrug resistance protein MdtO